MPDQLKHNEEIRVLLLNPTSEEHNACKRELAKHAFKRLRVIPLLTQPGKINAAFALTSHVLRLQAQGTAPHFVVCAGTSGSLSLELKSGDMVASASAIISDYQMLTEEGTQLSVYGDLDFKAAILDDMYIKCPLPLVQELITRLGEQDFYTGNMLTSDTFVVGRENKLGLGKKFNCLTCDMESGAFAYIAQNKFKLPWFNLRVVADSLDENVSHYEKMEEEMTKILGRHLATALQTLDELCVEQKTKE